MNHNELDELDNRLEPDIEVHAYSTSQLARDKIDARLRLLAMPPLEAQKLVELSLYPQYWEANIEDCFWNESLPTIDGKDDEETDSC